MRNGEVLAATALAIRMYWGARLTACNDLHFLDGVFKIQKNFCAVLNQIASDEACTHDVGRGVNRPCCP